MAGKVLLGADTVYVSLCSSASGLASQSDVSVAPTIRIPARPSLQATQVPARPAALQSLMSRSVWELLLHVYIIFIGMKAGTITEYYSLGVQLDI